MAVNPLDMSSLSSNINDPSYWDPTNPDSPFYDPSLDPTLVLGPSLTLSTQPTSPTSTNTTTTATNKDLSIEKHSHKSRLRHMRNRELHSPVQTQLTKNDVPLKDKSKDV